MGSSERVQVVQAVTRHQAMIKAYAYAIVRDFHLAEDVFQDVAIIVAEHWEEVPAGDGLVPWIREMARRKALEALRKQKRAAPGLSEDVLARLGEAFRPTAAPDIGDAMAGCLAKLARASRDILEARCGEGLDCETIAARFGRSVQSVYAIVKRARLFLAQCVDRTLAAQGRGGLP
jgi:RNA polymerase sigma-70 factor (ECF subfamily)